MLLSSGLPDKITQYERDNQTNRIVYSRYQQLEAEAVSQGYSLKYVASGEECYYIEGRTERVREGQFLLVNDEQEVAIHINSRDTVEGMCVFLSRELLNEVYQSLQSTSDQIVEGEGSAERFPGTFAARYLGSQSALGQYMGQLSTFYRGKVRDDFLCDKSPLYRLAELLCEQQAVVDRRMEQLQSRKRSTREELFRRLNMGLEYMHDYWQLPPKMPEVARAAALSEFHFYRLFRQAFSESPQQYLLRLRLDKSLEMLRNRHQSITEVAEACGFYDVHHFNKAFRKRFGERPSAVGKA